MLVFAALGRMRAIMMLSLSTSRPEEQSADWLPGEDPHGACGLRSGGEAQGLQGAVLSGAVE